MKLLPRISNHTYVIALILSTLLLCACSDEFSENGISTGNQMAFRVSIYGNETGQTRSDASSETFDVEEFGANGLYLFTLDSDDLSYRSSFASATTRALPIESMNDFKDKYSAFGLFAWNKSKGSSSYTGERYIDNGRIEFTIDKSGDCTANSIYSWPDDESEMKILCFAPYKPYKQEENGTDENEIAVIDYPFAIDDKNQSVEFNYTVPQNIAEQTDLLVASLFVPQVELSTKYLDLQFHHVLTAIKIKGADDLERKIERITIKNVHNSGNCSFSNGVTDFQWSIDKNAEKTEFSYKPSEFGLAGDESFVLEADLKEILNGEYTLMMIPQNLENAQLIIEFENNEIITGNISGEWKAGHTVTYVISPSDILREYHFKIESYNPETLSQAFDKTSTEFFSFSDYVKDYDSDNNETGNDNSAGKNFDLNYTASNLYFLIQSYKVVYKKGADGNVQSGHPSNATEHPVPINRTMVENQLNNWPAYAEISDITEDHKDILADKKFTSLYRVSVNQQQSSTYDKRFDLSTKGNMTEITAIDLSMTNGQMNTANCYVVNNAGWFMFPLVYGNAIKNGVENESSYKISGTNSLTKHDGTQITSPWIGNVNDAILLWADNNDFKDINPNKITEDGRQYVRFQIPESNNSSGGNFVIAVRDDSGDIMWSWHIWVTDYTPTSYSISDSDFMSENLGWVTTSISRANDTKRRFNLTISQEASQFSKQYTIKQAELPEIKNSGYGVFYQWGRKDPMPSLWFGNDAYKFRINSETIAKMNDCISNPNIMYKKEGSGTNPAWYSNKDYLWDISKSTDPLPVKTVYDPCPVGYRVPTAEEMGKIRDNGTWDSTNKGWQINNGEFFMPAMGYLSDYNEETNIFTSIGQNSQGFYWSSSLNPGLHSATSFYNTGNSGYMRDFFIDLFNGAATSAYSLRPIKE